MIKWPQYRVSGYTVERESKQNTEGRDLRGQVLSFPLKRMPNMEIVADQEVELR